MHKHKYAKRAPILKQEYGALKKEKVMKIAIVLALKTLKSLLHLREMQKKKRERMRISSQVHYMD